MLETVIDTAIGVVTGFIALAISHWIIAPKVSFSRELRVRWNAERERFQYTFRMKKLGLIDLIDTRIQCKIYVRDIRREGRKVWDIYPLGTTQSESLILVREAKLVHLRFSVLWEDVAEKYPIFAELTKIGIPECGLRPEDIFMSHREAHIRVFVMGHDRFTGVMKIFESPRYQMRDLRFGDWEDGKFVEAIHRV